MAALGHHSRPEVFCIKDVLRNFAKFTGKHLRQSLSFNKSAGLRQFIKKSHIAEKLFRSKNVIRRTLTFNFEILGCR